MTVVMIGQVEPILKMYSYALVLSQLFTSYFAFRLVASLRP